MDFWCLVLATSHCHSLRLKQENFCVYERCISLKKIIFIFSLLLVTTLACRAQGLLTPTEAVTSVSRPNENVVEEMFQVTSNGSAQNGATPTTFTVSESWLVTEIKTYHWNNGNGITPGTIGLMVADGTILGTWQADGLPGQGDVPDAYWVVNPNIVIPAGTYTVIDSDPDTWAQNAETNGIGMAWGLGIRQ